MLNDTYDLNSNRSNFNTGRDGYADDLHMGTSNTTNQGNNAGKNEGGLNLNNNYFNASLLTNPKFHTLTWTQTR